MTSPIENHTSKIENPDPDALTGLPLLRTWPAVYALVLAAFALTVLALYLFTRTFS